MFCTSSQFRKLAPLLASLSLVPIAFERLAMAQVTTAAIIGNVRDSSGTAIAGVAIAVTNGTTGYARSISSDSEDRLNEAFDANPSIYIPRQSTLSNVNDRRIYSPGTIRSVTEANSARHDATYHGLEVTARSRMAQGLTLWPENDSNSPFPDHASPLFNSSQIPLTLLGPRGKRTPAAKSAKAGIPLIADTWGSLPLHAGGAVSCTEPPISNTGGLR
jgi:hypothetical protein